jgi:hypothetical protein
MSGLSQFPFMKATQCRRSAATCGVFAANAVSRSDREFLLRMQRTWLDRAYHQDLIDGMPPRPPARSSALPVPRNRRAVVFS